MAQNQESAEPVTPEGGDPGFPQLTIGSRNWHQTDLATAILKGRMTSTELALTKEFFWVFGFKTVKTLLRSGELALSSEKLGRPLSWDFDDQRLLRESEDLRDELSAEVLLRAVPFFFKEGVKSWNPDKGAALTTYFVGTCTMVLNSAYRSWAKTRDRRWFTTADVAVAPWLDPNFSRAFSGQVEIEESIRQVFELAKPSQKPILGLLYQGYTATDAALALGLTRRTVEGRMHQLRKQVKLAVLAGKIAPPPGFTSVSSPDQATSAVML